MQLNIFVNKSKLNSIIFSFFIALIATLSNYYYADIDHIEQLPIIFRKINNNYLVNDFFVNSTSGFGPRYYYSVLISFLSKMFPVPLIFFILTLISNIVVSIISTLVAFRLFNNSKSIAFLASLFVMSVSTVSLGSDEIMYANALLPDRIAFPLIMLSFLFLLRKKIVVSGLIAGFASLFHILYGIGYGGIFILVYIISIFLESEKFKNHHKKIFWSGFILSVFFLFTLIPNYLSDAKKISDNEFISILAYFRHPHHYIPSFFLSFQELIKAFVLFGLASLSMFWIKNKYHFKNIISISIIIFILLVFGYIFVEIYPSRIWVTLQTFRYLNLLKWLSLVLISGMIISFFLKFNLFSKLFLKLSDYKLAYYGFFIAFLVLIALKIVYKPKIEFAADLNNKYFNPKFSLSDYYDDETEIAKYISRNTDKNAVFLTPPNFGKLRIFAQRAIVVDFKAFPFSDTAMKEWKNRIDNCYGFTNKSGFAALGELDNNYKQIDDEKTKKLQQIYGFQYIILYNTTKANFPILYQNNTYKLVKAIK